MLLSEQQILNAVFDSTNNSLNVTAAAEALKLSSLSDVHFTDETYGDFMFKTSGDWKNIHAGAAGSVLVTAGMSADPYWGAASSVGAGASMLSALGDVDFTDPTQGDLMYLNSAGNYANLLGGTAGNVLITAGLSAAPYWGTVSSVVGTDAISASSDTDFTDVTHGDVLFANSAYHWNNLGAGTAGQVLQTNGLSADPSWGDCSDNISAAPDTNFVDPTTGDILYLNSAANWMNIHGGTLGQYLQTNGLSASPTWTDITAPNISAVTSNISTITRNISSITQNVSSLISQLSSFPNTDITNQTDGDLLVVNSAGGWANMNGGTAGEILVTAGLSAPPYWGNISATTANIDAGTQTGTYLTPDATQDSKYNIRYFLFRVIEGATAWTVAYHGGDLESPITGTITEVGIYSDVAGVSNTGIVDLQLNGSSIVSASRVTIDTSEKTSRTAASPAYITTTAVSVGDLFTVSVISAHTTAAQGLTARIGINES